MLFFTHFAHAGDRSVGTSTTVETGVFNYKKDTPGLLEKQDKFFEFSEFLNSFPNRFIKIGDRSVADNIKGKKSKMVNFVTESIRNFSSHIRFEGLMLDGSIHAYFLFQGIDYKLVIEKKYIKYISQNVMELFYFGENFTGLWIEI